MDTINSRSEPATSGLTEPNHPTLPLSGSPWGNVEQLFKRFGEPAESETVDDAVAAVPAGHPGVQDNANQLVQVRLGIASALFSALKAKDAATAAHSYRVAIYCSTWAQRRGLTSTDRDALEVASLLHDLGKIGVPDNVLLKPSRLWVDEALVMERHLVIGLDILRACCSNEAVLEIVAHASTWYDGSHGTGQRVGEQIPLGARILSIANAFDAMTTDQVYRRALSRESAIAELFHCSGTQFDPSLVREFSELSTWDIDKLAREVEQEWLTALNPAPINGNWQLRRAAAVDAEDPDAPFRLLLPDQITDAVIFVDKDLRVLHWNHGAERLTGIAGSSMRGRHWEPAAIAMRDNKRTPIANKDCPVAHAILTGQPWVRRVQIKGRGRRRLSVDAHVTPVSRPDGHVEGATLLMHDVSPEISLEARCQSLHELATKDPLTQVANRAEFDRALAMFVVVHLEQNRPCSLIMSDIDHFKQVNDTYGHPAGDEVLKFVARVLRNSCRPGDLVVRYGGEEFVVLCTDCDNVAATRRAEEMRAKIAAQTHAILANQPVTISCGVTEIQPGDTPATMLRRADRAMYLAKGQGRNSVVQLGTGLDSAATPPEAAAQPADPCGETPAGVSTPSTLPASNDPAELIRAELEAWIPPAIALQKLHDFAADHYAEVLSSAANRLQLRIGSEESATTGAQRGKHPLTIELLLDEEQAPIDAGAQGPRSAVVRTRIGVALRLAETTCADRSSPLAAARQLMDSLKSYLVAHDAPQTT